MKAFIYKGEVYLRCVPGKNLFRSTMVHEAVNRGDIFALRVSDQQLTIISGKSEVEHIEGSFVAANPKPLDKQQELPYTAPSKSRKDALLEVRNAMLARKFNVGDVVRNLHWITVTKAIIGGFQWNHDKLCWQYSLRGFRGFYLETDLLKVE